MFRITPEPLRYHFEMTTEQLAYRFYTSAITQQYRITHTSTNPTHLRERLSKAIDAQRQYLKVPEIDFKYLPKLPQFGNKWNHWDSKYNRISNPTAGFIEIVKKAGWRLAYLIASKHIMIEGYLVPKHLARVSKKKLLLLEESKAPSKFSPEASDTSASKESAFLGYCCDEVLSKPKLLQSLLLYCEGLPRFFLSEDVLEHYMLLAEGWDCESDVDIYWLNINNTSSYITHFIIERPAYALQVAAIGYTENEEKPLAIKIKTSQEKTLINKPTPLPEGVDAELWASNFDAWIRLREIANPPVAEHSCYKEGMQFTKDSLGLSNTISDTIPDVGLPVAYSHTLPSGVSIAYFYSNDLHYANYPESHIKHQNISLLAQGIIPCWLMSNGKELSNHLSCLKIGLLLDHRPFTYVTNNFHPLERLTALFTAEPLPGLTKVKLPHGLIKVDVYPGLFTAEPPPDLKVDYETSASYRQRHPLYSYLKKLALVITLDVWGRDDYVSFQSLAKGSSQSVAQVKDFFTNHDLLFQESVWWHIKDRDKIKITKPKEFYKNTYRRFSGEDKNHLLYRHFGLSDEGRLKIRQRAIWYKSITEDCC